MLPLLIAILSGVGFIIAYNTYGRWLGRKIFRLSASVACPSVRLQDGHDYVPTSRQVVFGHHFTSIAGTGPIVGPAIAIMWGWLPALLWVVFGSIFIGAVHDFGALVVSLRNNGQTVGDIAGRVINRRVRLLFLFVLFLALTIVLAIFGLVIASVFRQSPVSIFPCVVQLPIAVAIGLWLRKQGASLLLPSLLALGVMYVTVFFGDVGFLHTINQAMAQWSGWTWVVVLLAYSYVASVLPVWLLLQPRDYINSLQLITALGLIVAGLLVAAFVGGAAPAGAERPALELVAPMINWSPKGAPLIFPFLFITIACGAISGFHCLVSSGTSSKQLKDESDARFVGYGSMLTEGFLAVLVIIACAAGLGLGVQAAGGVTLTGQEAWLSRYGEKVTAEQLSNFYRHFLHESRERHLQFNRYWWASNLAMLTAAFLAQLEALRARFARK
jgi:carbon starvation protein